RVGAHNGLTLSSPVAAAPSSFNPKGALLASRTFAASVIKCTCRDLLRVPFRGIHFSYRVLD
ncbi:MAG TPA: hypothetical protein VM821_05885, partial [Abditibacteriaceae bacterium]|nr:hypothetical protein [Abditibacteriaceae bacterium]